MKTLQTVLTIAMLIAVTISCVPIRQPTHLYEITRENIEAETIKGEPLIWTAEIEVDVEALRSEQLQELGIVLDDKMELIIVREHSEETNGVTRWYGKITDSPSSLVMFVITEDNTIAGNISLASGEFFKIRYLEAGKYVLAKIDRDKYLPDAPAVRVKEEIPIAMDPCPNTDPAHTIDVMVIYTDDARAASGSTASILSEVYLAVEETNQAYINSNITQRINLVYAAEVSYAETNNASTDLAALRSTSDGTLDDIHSVRDDHSADVVVMIVDSLGYCGIAYVMETVSTAFEPYAFAVVKRSCATGSFSFGHELGHVMGARHDCDNTPDLDPYDYAHGYYNTNPTPAGQANWRTIMSYNPTPSAARICYFSNPGITYPPGAADGDPMGSTAAAGTCQADNRQALNNTALSVANFRCTGSEIENVWMKDTWNDTGQEPDPNTASESMARSPYIWVRNDQDTDLVHHHQHENPITGPGVDNWIYVKLHNGGNAISGDLEVYYADASISLTWPTGWTLIDDAALNVDANSTEIVEMQWTNLPTAGGHYCLVARWDSASDPMHAPEGSNIGTNVRENNNIVWKNVTIVEATSGDAPVSADFQFNGLDEHAFIRIRCKDEYPYKAFTQHGVLTIEFDRKSQELLKDWRSDSRDIVREGNAFVIKGSSVDLKNLPFGKEHRGEVKITFHALKETPKTLYYLDVSHMTHRDGREIEVGSIAYEVDTQHR